MGFALHSSLYIDLWLHCYPFCRAGSQSEWRILWQQLTWTDMRRLSQDEFFCCFNRIAHQHIEHAIPSVFWNERRPTSYLRHCGRRIRQILIRSTTSSGVFCKRNSTAPGQMTLMNQGCRGDGISIPIPIPYPQESPLESSWESPYPRNPK